MTRLSRPWLLVVLAALAVAVFVGACGSDEQAASEDVNTVLRETFTGDKHVDSGRLSLSLSLDAKGSAQVRGPVAISLSGPFSSNGDKKLPSFALDATFSGAGQDIEGALTSTGDKGYVSFQGQPYVLDDRVFGHFKRGFEQAQRRERQSGTQSLATLGIDPRRWLRDARNEGEADVGGTKTIKITGRVDVRRLVEDLDQALRRASALGMGAGRKLPAKLTAAQQREIRDAVRRLDVEIYTGRDDKILRRLVIDADLKAPARGPGAGTTAGVRLDVSITDLNEPQEIETPQDARPFAELTRQLGGLGIGLGAGLGGGGVRGSDAGSSDALEKYAACIRAAGSDAAEAQKCAQLLTP